MAGLVLLSAAVSSLPGLPPPGLPGSEYDNNLRPAAIVAEFASSSSLCAELLTVRGLRKEFRTLPLFSCKIRTVVCV